MCLDFFIQKQSELGFKGDGRSFDPDADPSQSRIQVVVAPGGSGISTHVSDSCGLFGCYGPSRRNRVSLERGVNGSFSVTVSAYNSAAFGMAPAINARVLFQPDQRGGMSTSGERDHMPSLGIYHRVNGQWQAIQERPERGGFWLFPFMRNDRW